MRGRLRAADTAERRARWHTYHLLIPHLDPKTRPSLAEFVTGEKPPPQTGDEMLTIARQWHAAVNARPLHPLTQGS